MNKFNILIGVLALGASLSLAACNKADSGSPKGANSVATPAPNLTASVPPTASTNAAATPAAASATKDEAICAGCGKPESECTCGKDEAGKDGAAKSADMPAVPTSITLAGKSVPVISVAALNADPKSHAGLIAIDGTIGDIYADKGRFMLVDCGAGHCSDKNCAGCSADQQVPVRYDLASLKGDLPAKAQRVFVVAEVKPTATGGFTLAVHEVRDGEKTLCTVSEAKQA